MEDDPANTAAKSMNFIARNTPVVEDPFGHKILGGPQALMQFCAQIGTGKVELFSKESEP